MCGYYCIGFIDFILKGKSLFEYTNLFPPKEHEKNNKIILKYFQRIKTYLIVCDKCRKFKTLKYNIFLKNVGLSIVCSKCGNEFKIFFKD